jgi:general secretion pathway protein L
MEKEMKLYKENLMRLKRQVLSSRFLRWWLGELSTMVPAWTRAPGLTAQNCVLIPLDQVSTKWNHEAGNEKRDLALTLPSNHVMRKTLTLPLATETNLRQVLEFQMEQHTPFSSKQVYFGYRVTGRDSERGQLTIDFVATPRSEVDVAIKILLDLGCSVRAVFADNMLSSSELVNLLAAAPDKVPTSLGRGVNTWLFGLLGVLALAAMVLPLAIKREAVVQMLPWVDKAKKAAGTVDTMRQELEGRVAHHNYLLEKRQALPTVVQILEELTRVLPDDTWVQVLDIKGKELQIQGETASSVRLVGLFEQSSVFQDASFRASLTKGQLVGTERYQLALQIRPIVKAASVAASLQSPASSPASIAEKKP